MEQLPQLVTEATQAVFDTMIGLALTAGAPRWNGEPAPHADLVGIIGLAGRWTGSLSFHVSQEVAERITLGMLGFEAEEVSPEEVRDAIGEVTNMIAGQVKSRLQGGNEVAISLPSVIAGKDFVLQHPVDPPTLLVPFSSGGAALYVSVTLGETDGTPKPFHRPHR